MLMTVGIDARLWSESGVGRYIRNLTKKFDKSDLQFDIAIFLNGKDFEKVTFQNPRIRKVKADVRWHTLSEQWKFKKIIENQKIDLMHFPYFSFPAFYRRPFVITIHDLIVDHYPTGVASSLPLPFYYAKHLAYRIIIKKAVMNSQKIIVPSHSTKDELIDHYKAGKDKIEVIYEGFDPLIKKSTKKPLVSDNYILYVGNAYPHKNLERLLKAFKKVSKNQEIDLVCIGREDFFYRKIEKTMHSRVHFLHTVDDSELFDYYTNAKLLVMPSLMEGFGLPIVEAMSLSCPVVCSKIPALVEIGGTACHYFDPKNDDDIAGKITDVLNQNILRSRLIKEGLSRSYEYSWDICAKKTIEIYESCDSLRQDQ